MALNPINRQHQFGTRRIFKPALLSFLLIVFVQASSVADTGETLDIVTQEGPERFTIEIADTHLSRARGLMRHDHLASKAGMLFLYDEERLVSFWMKNVAFPLDILFIGKCGDIIKIHEKAIPETVTPIKSGAPVLAVLEITAGASKRAQITVGDKVLHKAFVDRAGSCN